MRCGTVSAAPEAAVDFHCHSIPFHTPLLSSLQAQKTDDTLAPKGKTSARAQGLIYPSFTHFFLQIFFFTKYEQVTPVFFFSLINIFISSNYIPIFC